MLSKMQSIRISEGNTLTLDNDNNSHDIDDNIIITIMKINIQKLIAIVITMIIIKVLVMVVVIKVVIEVTFTHLSFFKTNFL